MTDKTPAFKSEASIPMVCDITAGEMQEHMRRVETLCNVVESLIQGMVNYPMFSAMIPPDIREQFGK